MYSAFEMIRNTDGEKRRGQTSKQPIRCASGRTCFEHVIERTNNNAVQSHLHNSLPKRRALDNKQIF